MLAALSLILPLALAGAVSPVMLTEQTVLLAGAGGRRAALGFAAGVVLTLAVIVSAIVLFGRVIALPAAPHLDASLDIVLGLVLLSLAGIVHAAGRNPRQRAAAGSHRTRGTFAFGVFSMATNVTTLALIIPAAKEIASAQVDVAGRAVLAALLIAVATVPAWGPLAVTAAAPGTGGRALDALGEQIRRHGRTASVGLLALAGAVLVGRGTIRLLA